VKTAEAWGKALRARRTAAGLSVVDLAAASGVSAITIYRLETGKAQPQARTRRDIDGALKEKTR
jgi:transcriptional regulator with XRE-family HTH domain